MSDFSFVGAAYEAASPTQDNQSLINWYPEADPTKKDDNPFTPDGRGVIALYPCPGTTSLCTLTADTEVRGFHVLPGGLTMIAVSGADVYSLDTNYTKTSIGTLKTSTGIVYIADNGVAAMITDGVARYSYVWGTGTFAELVDGPFTVGQVCGEVDNFIFYNNPNTNQFGCTSVGDIASNSLNVGSKIGSSDNLMSIIADHRQLLILGEKTSERWINVGTFPFPFAIIPGTSMQHGLQAVNSVARLGEGVAFLAMDDRGQATVIMWGAALSTPARISTYAIEHAIQGYAVTSDAIGFSYSQDGHEFYVLTFPSADVTWCFDLSSGLWHRRAWRDANNVYHRHRSNCVAVFNNQIVVGDFENGKIYEFSLTDYTDDGDPLPCVRRCPHLTNDLKMQFFSDLQIQFQPGVGIQTGQGSDPECILRWSNDGGFTWGNDHILKIGQAGKYKNRAIKRRLGYARDRVFEIEVTDPVFRAVISANLNATVGAN